jgi:hypothetical protein
VKWRVPYGVLHFLLIFIDMIKLVTLLKEITNPYSVEWVEPDTAYFTQELSELLGNEMRFSKKEFFHPQNYDLMYSLFPHTFKMIAEHSKGSEVENKQEIKDILLNKEISDLMNDWGDFRHTLMKDSEAKKEALSLFKKGKMEEWPDDKINKTFYMGAFKKLFPKMFKDTTSSGLMKQMKGETGETEPHFKGYEKNIQDFRNEKHRKLPAPFIMKLPSGGREGNEYTLIGGHKRSTIAHQLNIPIKVWFIDLIK